ncbi:PH domain-containing protein [Kitasatospora sp. NPDC091207]|uniref:PH domain-containing protein n=1 Tax=Kitasatospora sp. NPDC091207 TaxID=3364083 RepID=UPI0037FA5FD7
MSTESLRLPHEYRVASTRIGGFAFTILLLSGGALLPLWADEEFSSGTKGAGTLVILGLCLLLVLSAAQAATVVTTEGIKVRGMIRRRRLAWADIEEIRKQPNPNAHLGRGAPRFLTYAHLAGGRKVLLPFVDDKHVVVDREVARLTELLTRHRQQPDDAGSTA